MTAGRRPVDDLGLTANDRQALRRIRLLGEVTVARLADELGRSDRSMRKTVERLSLLKFAFVVRTTEDGASVWMGT